MALSPVALICLGLCLGQAWSAQQGPLPKPILRALPSPLVPLKKPVTLRCQAPPDMDVYRLEKLGSATYRDQTVLNISAMTLGSAGRYRCSYQNGTHWSPSSDQLELVATGVYAKPALSALPGATVPRGGNVTLQCQTRHGFDQFALYKEGDAAPVKKLDRWYHANFPLLAVQALHSGVYRCYSFSSSAPYLWSAPSNPLHLVVTGASGTTRQQPMNVPSPAPAPAPASELPETVIVQNFSVLNKVSSSESTRKTPETPKGPPTAPGAPLQRYSTGNVVRMCLGAVALVLLGGVLLEDWHSRRKALLARALHRPLPRLPQGRGGAATVSGAGMKSGDTGASAVTGTDTCDSPKGTSGLRGGAGPRAQSR
ncbi:platelet glycoprotein VI [Sorex araneus]|uniref:platelet glycoprotein VI n=1 Tax=Sorex araneus TaxID=42254 RepID=UPI002433956B|nr:platelet glycoprotein VI [Sorex araneus]